MAEYYIFFWAERGISYGDGFENVKIGGESYFRDGCLQYGLIRFIISHTFVSPIKKNMIHLCLLSVVAFFGLFFTLTLKAIKEQEAQEKQA